MANQDHQSNIVHLGLSPGEGKHIRDERILDLAPRQIQMRPNCIQHAVFTKELTLHILCIQHTIGIEQEQSTGWYLDEGTLPGGVLRNSERDTGSE